jgi:hypothetical protein
MTTALVATSTIKPVVVFQRSRMKHRPDNVSGSFTRIAI